MKKFGLFLLFNFIGFVSLFGQDKLIDTSKTNFSNSSFSFNLLSPGFSCEIFLTKKLSLLGDISFLTKNGENLKKWKYINTSFQIRYYYKYGKFKLNNSNILFPKFYVSLNTYPFKFHTRTVYQVENIKNSFTTNDKLFVQNFSLNPSIGILLEKRNFFVNLNMGPNINFGNSPFIEEKKITLGGNLNFGIKLIK